MLILSATAVCPVLTGLLLTGTYRCRFLCVQRCVDLRDHLLGQQRDTQASLERLKALIRLIQRDQLIQVTMTASLLTQSWIKATSTAAGPSATPLQKSHSQDDDNDN